LDDGTAGLRAIKKHGGITIVQDPADASYPAMPENAIYNNSVDHIVRAGEIGPLLVQLVNEEILSEGGPEPLNRNAEKEVAIIQQTLEPKEMIEAAEDFGRLSMFTCPECHGTLWEMKDGELLRYRCHVGHGFSSDSLDAEQGEKLESALWSALRALEERGGLARRLAQQSRETERESLARRFEARANEADEHAASIRKVLLGNPDKPLAAAR